MTNSELLSQKIAESGLKLSWIADQMSISRASLYNKLENKRPFNQYEIASLTNILHLNSKMVKDIFFTQQVD